MRRRLLLLLALVPVTLTAMATPAYADNCGTFTDCFSGGKGILAALAAVLVIAGVAAILIGGAGIMAGLFGGGLLVAIGDGVVVSAGAVPAAAVETLVSGLVATAGGVLLSEAADDLPAGGSSGGSSSGGSSSGGSSSGGSAGLKPPAPWPRVSDPKLDNIVTQLFKGTKNPNRVGDGTTMDAVRNELTTGESTAAKFHLQKARDSVRALRGWLRRNPGASQSDRDIAQKLLDALNDALAGQ